MFIVRNDSLYYFNVDNFEDHAKIKLIRVKMDPERDRLLHFKVFCWKENSRDI